MTARPEFLASTNGHGTQEGSATGVATLLRAERVVTAQAQISAATEQLPMLLPAQEPRSARFAYGWFASVVLCSAAGLCVLAVADEASRRQNTSVPTYMLFWLGVLLIFVPIAFRVLARDVSTRERLTLIVFLGLALEEQRERLFRRAPQMRAVEVIVGVVRRNPPERRALDRFDRQKRDRRRDGS